MCEGVLGDVVPCYVQTTGIRIALHARACPKCSPPPAAPEASASRRAVITPGDPLGIPTARLV